MPLVSIGPLLKQAQAQRFAVPLFDAFDALSAEGMILALEQKRAPGIIAIYTKIMDEPATPALAAYIHRRAQTAGVPISLMLDHGADFETCMKAVTVGCTDIMYDGSKLALDENIVETAAIARAGHALGVCVEAELGHVGQGSDYLDFGAQRKGFTEPAIVERFVAETGIDFLAVAIGNAHGLYKGEPKLDIVLLREIRARTSVPLVLHGGTGIPEAQFRAAIAAGVCKINVATDLFVNAGKSLVDASKAESVGYFELTKAAVDSFAARCGYYLDLFGASGKA